MGQIGLTSNRCSDGPVHLARPSCPFQVGQRPRVHSSGFSRLDCGGRSQDGLHRTRLALGERVLRKLQCPVPRRTAERRDILLSTRSTDHHRKLEETLQHQTTPQRSGLPPTRPRNHHPDGKQANHALTFKLDHSSGADYYLQSLCKLGCLQWRTEARLLYQPDCVPFS